MSDSVIYKLDLKNNEVSPLPDPPYKLHQWKPSLKSGLWVKRFPKKYILFCILHFLGIFKNKSYSSFIFYDQTTICCALMVVPAFYRWPFMGKRDVQLTYVITHPDYRRRKLASTLIKYTLKSLQSSNRIDQVWYVTTTDNTASRALCESLGFRFEGNGQRVSVFNGLYKKLLLRK